MITKNTKLCEILEINPQAGEILMDAGMGCIGCPMAQQETLEDGCLAHGMDEKDIEKLIGDLNK